MAFHNQLGKKGEELAVDYLQNKGFEILVRNWKSTSGEIDIVCKDCDEIVFVEVKTRTSSHWGSPEDAVSEKKIRRLVAAANMYIQENDINLPSRFDIISLIINNKETDIEHFCDAFLAPLN